MSAAIGPGMFVEVHYTLRDGRGNFLESTEGEKPYGFVYGFGTLLPSLEQALEGAQKGEVLNVTVDPEDGYGTRDSTDVFEVDRDEFPDTESIAPGAEFTAEGDDGTTLTMRVLQVHDDHVVVDANHPLAGETLNFQVRVVSVRAATEQEVLTARTDLAEQRGAQGRSS